MNSRDKISAAIRAIEAKLTVQDTKIVEAEKKAGIFDQAEKIRKDPPPYHGGMGIHEIGSPEQDEIDEEIESHHGTNRDRLMRSLYFSVSDPALRKFLISTGRERWDLFVEKYYAELDDQRLNLERENSIGEYWWLEATIYGGIAIAIGQGLFGLAGALGGALCGLFIGQKLSKDADKKRIEAVAVAEEAVKEAKEWYEKVRDTDKLFSRREERSGEPDNPTSLT